MPLAFQRSTTRGLPAVALRLNRAPHWEQLTFERPLGGPPLSLRVRDVVNRARARQEKADEGNGENKSPRAPVLEVVSAFASFGVLQHEDLKVGSGFFPWGAVGLN